MDKDKALGLFRLRLSGAMSQFSIYGLDIFIAEAIKTIEDAALEMHERLNELGE